MRGTIRTAAALALDVRALARLALPAVGLLAILAGILGMHMAFDPQPAAEHASPHAAAAEPTSQHSQVSVPDASGASGSSGHHADGCAQCGPAGCMAGLCILFLLLVSLAALLDPLRRLIRGRETTGSPGFLPTAKAPPRAPSLNQLCISRT
ncbi:DUF6153 family protein [Arthrobacter koreensis]|uniref:DUF6153 family protein n=1 Tax=Arthrobacter koreensis TaxID=199136 RepID=UPI00382B0242